MALLYGVRIFLDDELIWMSLIFKRNLASYTTREIDIRSLSRLSLNDRRLYDLTEICIRTVDRLVGIPDESCREPC